MILIADSGSTKTDWCVVKQGEILQQISTKGMNPFFQTEEEMEAEVRNELWQQLKVEQLSAVYFYGAGCTPEKAAVVHSALKRTLPVSGTIEVCTDMLGAARALCGHKAGIACILGTGSNSCLYDGSTMTHNVSPLGFILGDEGSGAMLGKLLVGDLLKNQMPPGLKEKFLTQFSLSPAIIIDRVYRQPFPNRFLAGLSPFLAQNMQEPSIHSLVLGAFEAFIRRNVMQYPGWQHLPVHFTGSVAYHYRFVLAQAAAEMGIELGEIEQSPMPGLVEYHSSAT